MKCPACSKELVAYTAGEFEVDICRDGCSGIWFDQGELEKVDEYEEKFPEDLLRVRKVAAVAIDRARARACPCCAGKTLQRVMLDPEKLFEIDRCASCGGSFLDIGELEFIRETDKANKELDARLAGYEARVNEQLKQTDGARKVAGLVRLLFR